MAPHSSTLAWKIPRTEEPGRLQSMGSLRVGHNWATSLSLFLSCFGEGSGNPLQCSCLENSRDRGAWWAAVYGVAQNRTRLKRLSSSNSKVSRIETNRKIITEWMNGDKNKTSIIPWIVVLSVFIILNVGNLHLESIMIKGLSYLLLYLFIWNYLISKADIIIKNACAKLDWIMVRKMK